MPDFEEYYLRVKSELDDTQFEIADLRSANAELKRQLADDRDLLIRIESELSGVKYAGHYDAGIRAIKQQLAESQAREARLREALQFLNARIITTDLGGVVEKALALPHDDTALREYRDAVIEECAKVCDYFEEKADALNDSISDDDDHDEGRSEWIMGKAEAASRIGQSLRKMKSKS